MFDLFPPLPDRLKRSWLQLVACAALLVAAQLAVAGTAGQDPELSTVQAPEQFIAPRDNHVLATAYWEDRDGLTDIETAKKQIFTPVVGIFNRGYTQSVHWVRLTIAASNEPLALRLLPPWLDQITLYDPAAERSPVTVGDQYPQPSHAFSGIGHFFTLPAQPEPRDIWLRLQTTSSHLLNAQAVSLDRLAVLNTSRTIWSALYTAFMVFLLLMLLPIWWVQRDKLLGIFLVKHVVYSYYGAAYLGFPTLLLSDWLPPAFFDKAFAYATVLITPLALWSDIVFLSLYRPHRHLLSLIQAIAGASVCNVLLMLAGYTSVALQLNLLLILAAVLTVMPTALSGKPDQATEQVMPKKVVVAYYALILGNLPLGVITLLGWVAVREWSLYILIMHGLVAVLMMATILFVRAHRLANHSERLDWELQQTQQEMALEQGRRQEQSQFMHMLMHELKTPLSVVAMALGTRQQQQKNLDLASSAVQDMKAILDRCIQADQVGELSLDQRCEAVDVADTLRSLAPTFAALEGRLQLSAAEAVIVQSDHQLLKIIVSNLLDNAARYSDPLTPVQVTLEPEPQAGRAGVAVHVSNTPGLAGWPDAELIFSKYYRSVGAQRDSGSGLGLFLAQQLASSLGGSLRYVPSPQFVEFILWLPQSPT